jgi:hypothetical protein
VEFLRGELRRRGIDASDVTPLIGHPSISLDDVLSGAERIDNCA